MLSFLTTWHILKLCWWNGERIQSRLYYIMYCGSKHRKSLVDALFLLIYYDARGARVKQAPLDRSYYSWASPIKRSPDERSCEIWGRAWMAEIPLSYGVDEHINTPSCFRWLSFLAPFTRLGTFCCILAATTAHFHSSEKADGWRNKLNKNPTAMPQGQMAHATPLCGWTLGPTISYVVLMEALRN